MSKIEVIYWNSDVFIDAIQQKNPARTQVLKQIVEAAGRNEIRILTSTLAKVEVCKIKDVELFSEEQDRTIVAFFDNDYITVRPVDDEIAEMARYIARHSSPSLKPGDAIHIATAILNHVSVMHTYDEKIRKNSGRFDGLRTEEPKWRGQQVLPEMENITSSSPLADGAGITINRRSV